MMAFWKKWFGGSAAQDDAEEIETVHHEGYAISPSPVAEGGQYRLAATITRETDDGTVRIHRLIRADLFMTSREASDAAVRKARQVIKEQGDAMFDDPRG